MTRRENSFSDSEGRSLTPDLSEEEDHGFIGPSSPTQSPVAENGPGDEREQPQQQHFVYPPSEVQRPVQSADAPPPLMTESSPNVLFQDPPPAVLVEATSAPASVPTRSTTMGTTGQSSGKGSSQSPPRPGVAAERFRASVRRVIHMNRASSAMSLGGIGAEPGIDPRRSSAYLNYGHIRQKCEIELVDYSSVRASFGRMRNKGFVDFMADRRASKREAWVKVRWINIGGVSWDVISALALRYDIHPLALEDVLHRRGSQSRSKADYYLQHLFIRILRHILAPDDVDNPSAQSILASSITRLPRSSSPDSMEDKMEDEEGLGSGSWGDDMATLAGSRFSTKRAVGSIASPNHAMQDLERGRRDKPRAQSSLALRMRRKRAAEEMTIEELKKGERVNVETSPFFVFLFRDGTVISISQSTDVNFTAPIIARLRQKVSGLRLTADPSLLVQSLLDLIVDQAMEVVDEYQSKILKLEHDILVKPSMKAVRYLHILSGDLTLHKRTLEPIKTLIYGMRRYDVDRCAALINSAGQDTSNMKVEGYMSHKSKIYLADVHDHIDFIINSLDMFSGIAENLINFTFNMASYEMNEVMRRLTLATIIFLPLTLLTGYFGMNFMPFSAVDNHSDLLFWEIALPVMAVVIPLFMWPDLVRVIHYVKKRWAAHKVKRNVASTMRKTQ